MATTWHGWTGPVPKPRRWVFLVGCYNSGTTLLHDLLAAHPDVASLPAEGQFLTDQLPLPRDLGLPRLWAADPQRFMMGAGQTIGGRTIDVRRIKRQWGGRYNDHRRPILLEKSPTNTARIEWLSSHFEGAAFIGIIRDGYAVAEGIHRKAGHALASAAHQWKVSNRVMLDAFRSVPDCLTVRYEELAADAPAVLGRVYSFLDMPGEVVALDSSRALTVHERTSPIIDLNPESWRRLSQDDLSTIEQVAGEMLIELGYARPSIGSVERA